MCGTGAVVAAAPVVLVAEAALLAQAAEAALVAQAVGAVALVVVVGAAALVVAVGAAALVATGPEGTSGADALPQARQTPQASPWPAGRTLPRPGEGPVRGVRPQVTGGWLGA